jgi:hypothetical protein
MLYNLARKGGIKGGRAEWNYKRYKIRETGRVKGRIKKSNPIRH